MNALDLAGVCKICDGKVILNEVSFSIESGNFIGLLGRNGAGKSTLLEIITGITEKTSGNISVFSKNLDKFSVEAKSMIGFVSQDYNFNQFDTVMQVIVNQAGLYGIPQKLAREKAEYYLKKLGIYEQKDLQTRFLSGGMKKRMMLIRAVIHEPKLLILDELTAGVDLEIRHLITDFLANLNHSGVTIIMVTHYIEEIERLCNKVVILDNGKIFDYCTIAEIRNKMNKFAVVVNVQQPVSMQDLNELNATYVDEFTFELILEIGIFGYSELLHTLESKKYTVVSILEKSSRLEQYFLSLNRNDKNCI